MPDRKRHDAEIDALITPVVRRYLNELFALYDMKWVAHWTKNGVRLRMRHGVSFEADLGFAQLFLALSRTEQQQMIQAKLPFDV